MRVLIPTNHKTVKEGICVSFGRAPHFMIVDLQTGEETFIENKGATSGSGAGIKAAQTVVDSKVNAMITPRIGKNAADVISASGITIYKSESESIESNLKCLSDGKLAVLTDIHPGFHGHRE